MRCPIIADSPWRNMAAGLSPQPSICMMIAMSIHIWAEQTRNFSTSAQQIYWCGKQSFGLIAPVKCGWFLGEAISQATELPDSNLHSRAFASHFTSTRKSIKSATTAFWRSAVENVTHSTKSRYSIFPATGIQSMHNKIHAGRCFHIFNGLSNMEELL